PAPRPWNQVGPVLGRVTRQVQLEKYSPGSIGGSPDRLPGNPVEICHAPSDHIKPSIRVAGQREQDLVFRAVNGRRCLVDERLIAGEIGRQRRRSLPCRLRAWRWKHRKQCCRSDPDLPDPIQYSHLLLPRPETPNIAGPPEQELRLPERL